MEKMHIRWAELQDAEILGTIHALSWKISYKGIMPDDFLNNISIEKRQIRFRSALIEKTEENAVAIVDGEIVGFICIGNNRDKDLDDTYGEIWGIYLHPKQWKKGFGQALIKWGLQELAIRGYKKVVLWVLEENYNARSFYEVMNFSYDGTEKEIKIGKSLKEIRYVKSI